MMLKTNEYERRMWSDSLHRVEVKSVATRVSDGASLLAGWLRADTPEAIKANPRPVDVPFSVTLPASLDSWAFHGCMTVMFNRLRAGESLEGLNFASEPPAPVQTETNWGGILLLGLAGSRGRRGIEFGDVVYFFHRTSGCRIDQRNTR